MTDAEFPAPPVDTHPVHASGLAVKDHVWIGYRSGEALVGVVEDVGPVANGDYCLVIRPNDSLIPVEPRLFADDYPGLHRFYRVGKFTDAVTDDVVCVLLGDVIVSDGEATVATGTETVSVGEATSGLLDTLEFLSRPRLVDDAELFSLPHEAELTKFHSVAPDRLLAGRGGNARNSAEAATLARFKQIAPRLYPGAVVETEGRWEGFLRPDPNQDGFAYLTEWMQHYLPDPAFAGRSLYDFAKDAGTYSDTPVEDVTRQLLFGLNHVVGNGVTLVRVPDRRFKRGVDRVVRAGIRLGF